MAKKRSSGRLTEDDLQALIDQGAELYEPPAPKPFVQPEPPAARKPKVKLPPLRERCPTEHYEQCQVIKWADSKITRRTYPELEMLYAVPNGGHRHARVGAQLRDEGTRRGVPDLSLDVARGGYFGLRIEMKRRIRSLSTLSDDQKWWHAKLTERGYMVVTCYGAEEAISAIKAYLQGDPTCPN